MFTQPYWLSLIGKLWLRIKVMKKALKAVESCSLNELPSSLGLSSSELIFWEVRYSVMKNILELFDKKVV